MWSPKRNTNGARNPAYDRMTHISPGDVVFSYAKARIMAVGVALTDVQDSPKPKEFGAAGAAWDDDGWLVEVAFQELIRPLIPRHHMRELAPLLPERGSPIRSDGNGNQAYLFAIPDLMAEALARLIGPGFHRAVANRASLVDVTPADDAAQKSLLARTDIGAVEKAQLVRARRGQGLFRIAVHGIEPACRVTGVTNLAMLRASHIKPWRAADDSEKLDANNGLMLAPHVDLLFDQGFITFEGNGAMELSPALDLDVLAKWAIPQVLSVGKFNADQREYLRYHTQEIFRASA